MAESWGGRRTRRRRRRRRTPPTSHTHSTMTSRPSPPQQQSQNGSLDEEKKEKRGKKKEKVQVDFANDVIDLVAATMATIPPANTRVLCWPMRGVARQSGHFFNKGQRLPSPANWQHFAAAALSSFLDCLLLSK